MLNVQWVSLLISFCESFVSWRMYCILDRHDFIHALALIGCFISFSWPQNDIPGRSLLRSPLVLCPQKLVNLSTGSLDKMILLSAWSLSSENMFSSFASFISDVMKHRLLLSHLFSSSVLVIGVSLWKSSPYSSFCYAWFHLVVNKTLCLQDL